MNRRVGGSCTVNGSEVQAVIDVAFAEFSQRYGVPFEATRGGPETMYPEYRKKLTGAVAKRPAQPGGGD